MRSKSQQLMNEISACVDPYYSERHTAPSVNEIAKGFGIAKTTSYRYLVAMNDLGIPEKAENPIQHDLKAAKRVSQFSKKF